MDRNVTALARHPIADVQATDIGDAETDNTRQAGWMDFLAVPWHFEPATPATQSSDEESERDGDAEELRSWAEMAWETGERWQAENPY